MPRRTRSTRSNSPAHPVGEPAKPEETAHSHSTSGTITNFFKSVLGWGSGKTKTTTVMNKEPQDPVTSAKTQSPCGGVSVDRALEGDQDDGDVEPMDCESPTPVEPPPSDEAKVPESPARSRTSNSNSQNLADQPSPDPSDNHEEEPTFPVKEERSSESPEKANGNCEENTPATESSEKGEKSGCSADEIAAPDNLNDVVVDQEGILTNEMIEEEKHLHEESVKEDEKVEQQRRELIAGMTSGLREERYKRLQYLLTKSNMYTEYLINRMERQKEEEAKRRERLQRRREAARRRKEVAETAKAETEKDGGENSAAMGGEVPPGVKAESRGRKIVLTDSQKSSQDSQKSVGSRKGRKRNISKVDETGDADKQDSKKQRAAGGDSMVEDKENVSGIKATVDTTSTEVKEEGEVSSPTDEERAVSEEDKLYVGENYLINGERPHCEQPVLFSGGVLRQYQIEGYKWLGMLYENGVNGILADEMGLGKTIQVIALIAHLSNMGVGGPFLIVGPLSTLPNWISEFERFAPKVPVILYHGTKEERAMKRRKIRRSHAVRKNIRVQPTVITSYEIAMNDRKNLQNHDWKYLIVDEGHRIKNSKCRLIHELKLYNSTHRILLTGTPLQNNLAELWSLLNFLLPEIFDDLGSFEAWFDVDLITGDGSEQELLADQQRHDVLSMLHQILTPFLLRRLKCDVDLCIPPKREVLVYAPMTVAQEEYYSAIVNKTVLQMIDKRKNIEEKVELTPNGRVQRRSAKKVNYQLFLGNEDGSVESKGDNSSNGAEDDDIEEWVQAVLETNNNRLAKEEKKTAYSSKVTIKMANIMMQLKKCCNHPYLLEYPLDADGEYLVDQGVVNNSGKMLLVDRMLKELSARGHKVLLFSQMTTMLDIIQDYCVLKKLKFCRLDGSSRVDDRREQIDSFNKDPKIFLFLLSTRAGGLGLNLVSADTVVIFDSDWNPQCDLQAQDRCHRIGQTRPVVIYRLITANTIDQRIVERATAKRKLEKMVIHKGKFKSGIKNFTTSREPMSPEELLALLNSSDHQGIVKGREGEVISEGDLQKLLDRSDLEKMWQKQQHRLKNGESRAEADSEPLPDAVEEVSGIFKVLETESGRLGMGKVCETKED